MKHNHNKINVIYTLLSLKSKKQNKDKQNNTKLKLQNIKIMKKQK